jgi:hypothetical protein
MLASGTQDRGFKPGRSRRIFSGRKKILSMPSFGREVKLWVTCRIFTARKRSLAVSVEVVTDKTKLPGSGAQWVEQPKA